MSLTREQIDHIAALARLEISDEERDDFVKKLSSILEYVDTLATADIDGVEPMSHSIAMHNVLREDVERACPSAVRDALVEAFPEKEGDLLKVKAVFS